MIGAAAAEALLSAFAHSMNNAFREEEQLWQADYLAHNRALDADWMQSQRSHWTEQASGRARRNRWREEDLMQCNLENARCLWLRFVEKNRRDVEEKMEQLKAVSNLAAIFAGFAIVTLTQFSPQPGSFQILISIYGVLTAIVEGLMTISMVTCTFIMGSILKIGKTYNFANTIMKEQLHLVLSTHWITFGNQDVSVVGNGLFIFYHLVSHFSYLV